MIEYAVLCIEERHRHLPAVRGWDWDRMGEFGWYAVIPWRCPCGKLVAQTVVSPVLDPASVMTRYRPVREQGDPPAYRPTARSIRGKGERRAPRYDALGVPPGVTRESVIDERTFDAWCLACGRRLRFVVPDAITTVLES